MGNFKDMFRGSVSQNLCSWDIAHSLTVFVLTTCSWMPVIVKIKPVLCKTLEDHFVPTVVRMGAEIDWSIEYVDEKFHDE